MSDLIKTVAIQPAQQYLRNELFPPRFEGIKVYCWKYDDGTWGLAARDKSEDKEKKLYDCGVFGSKAELDERISSIRKDASDNKKEFRKKRMDIPTGLDHVEKSIIPSRDIYLAEEGWDELGNFLNSCGTDDASRREVLQLFSGMLAGYCARLAEPILKDKKSSPVMDDAPLIAVGYEDNLFDFLYRAHLALAIGPDFDGKLFSSCPSILPPGITVHSLDECAAIQLSKSKNKLFREIFPAQYRDTSVLIHSKFFSMKDIRKFRQRNRWATMVLYGNSGKKLCDAPIRLKANILAKADFSWDPETIQYLVLRYMYDLSKLKKQSASDKKKLRREIDRIEQCLFQYQQQKGTKCLTPAEQYWFTLQMLALSLFLKTCEKLGIFDKQERQRIRVEWFNLLLPNCCIYMREEDSDEGDYSEEGEGDSGAGPVYDPVQIFEDTLKGMLRPENRRHFLFVPQKGSFDRSDPDDPSCMYWGYLRMYPPENKKKFAFRALQIRQEDFEAIAPELWGDQFDLDVSSLIENLRGKDPDYLYSKPTARFPIGNNRKENAIPAIALMVDKLTFLDADQVAFLQGEFPQESNKSDA